MVDAPLRIIQQTPASGTLTVYETSPAIPSLKVTAAYDSAMSWVFDAKLYYRASAIDGWSTADAPPFFRDFVVKQISKTEGHGSAVKMP